MNGFGDCNRIVYREQEKEKKHEENDIDSGSDYSCSMVDGKYGGFGSGAGNSPVCERAVSECRICR